MKLFASLCLLVLCVTAYAGSQHPDNEPRCMCCFNLRAVFTPSRCSDYGYRFPSADGVCGLIGGPFQECGSEAELCSAICQELPLPDEVMTCENGCRTAEDACQDPLFQICEATPAYMACAAEFGPAEQQCGLILENCLLNLP